VGISPELRTVAMSTLVRLASSSWAVLEDDFELLLVNARA